MNWVVVSMLLGAAGLQGCVGATAAPTAPVAVHSPPIEEKEEAEGGAWASSAEPAADGEVAAEDAPQQVEVADEDVNPSVTEACVNACRATGAELLQAVDNRLAQLQRDCGAGPTATRKKCLAAAQDEYVEARQAAEGGEHACRTSCPGYMNQYR
jgi:hypothetical protein